MRSFITCLLLLASLPVFGEKKMQICWIRRVSLSGDGDAAITFDKVASGFAFGISPSEGRVPIYSLDPEKTGKNGEGLTMLLPRGKTALLLTAHDRCEFKWERQGDFEGIRVEAVNTYFMHGSNPDRATIFLAFEGQ